MENSEIWFTYDQDFVAPPIPAKPCVYCGEPTNECYGIVGVHHRSCGPQNVPVILQEEHDG